MTGSTRSGSADDPTAALDRVDAALTDGRPEDALRLSDEALSRWPRDAELRHARGVALRQLERPEEALDEMQEALRLDRTLVDAWLDGAEILIEDLEDDVAALELLAQARRRVDDPGARAEVELLRGIALSHLEDYSGALQALDEASKLDASHPDVLTERGAVLVELLRFEEAEASLRRSLELGDDSARLHELLAFVLDYSGRREAAARHFRLASEIDPDIPAEPVRVDDARFDELVAAAVAAIPEPFAGRLKNVEISTENYADKDFCRRHDCSPTVLGLYVGTPMTERGANDAAPPDRIVLFQRALENAAATEDDLRHEIEVTVRHEVGHLLGLSEQELHDAGHG